MSGSSEGTLVLVTGQNDHDRAVELRARLIPKLQEVCDIVNSAIQSDLQVDFQLSRAGTTHTPDGRTRPGALQITSISVIKPLLP